MTTTTTLAPAQAPTSRRHPGSDVWDKLWHHRPSKSQDEANLKRSDSASSSHSTSVRESCTERLHGHSVNRGWTMSWVWHW